MPDDVHQALLDYLRCSGRLDGIHPEAYIFAPLADPLRREARGHASDWNPDRFLSSHEIYETLKAYGRLAGIPAEKLTLPGLRHTAAMLRLEAGDTLEEIQAFLHHSTLKSTRYYLARLPVPAPAEGPFRDVENDPPRLPERKPAHFQPGDNFVHGLYALSQPPDELAAIQAEDIQDMGEQITDLRVLSRGLLEMQNRAADHAELLRLHDAYTLAAVRLADMIKADGQLRERRRKDNQAQKQRLWAFNSEPEPGEEIDVDIDKDIPEDQMLPAEAGAPAATLGLEQEIASTRLSLRRIKCLVGDADEAPDLIRLVEAYVSGCSRLVRLLKAASFQTTDRERKQAEMIEEALLEVM